MTGADVFYFGNAVGETGDRDGSTMVNAADLILARNAVTSPFDTLRLIQPYWPMPEVVGEGAPRIPETAWKPADRKDRPLSADDTALLDAILAGGGESDPFSNGGRFG